MYLINRRSVRHLSGFVGIISLQMFLAVIRRIIQINMTRVGFHPSCEGCPRLSIFWVRNLPLRALPLLSRWGEKKKKKKKKRDKSNICDMRHVQSTATRLGRVYLSILSVN